jgi:hypothetical protein
MSLGGLELVVRQLLAEQRPGLSVEAAGVLTQITAPSHSFGGLPRQLPEVIQRLLVLCDWSQDSESFLLSVGSLGNLSLHQASVSSLLYRYNAPRRLSAALLSPKAQSSYARDQIATVLGRLAANGFEEALVAQGCVPTLLSLLASRDQRNPGLARNVRYKAAICLGSLGSLGLKALHEAGGIPVLQSLVEEGGGQKASSSQSPTCLICASLLTRLMEKYTLITAV